MFLMKSLDISSSKNGNWFIKSVSSRGGIVSMQLTDDPCDAKEFTARESAYLKARLGGSVSIVKIHALSPYSQQELLSAINSGELPAIP